MVLESLLGIGFLLVFGIVFGGIFLLFSWALYSKGRNILKFRRTEQKTISEVSEGEYVRIEGRTTTTNETFESNIGKKKETVFAEEKIEGYSTGGSGAGSWHDLHEEIKNVGFHVRDRNGHEILIKSSNQDIIPRTDKIQEEIEKDGDIEYGIIKKDDFSVEDDHHIKHRQVEQSFQEGNKVTVGGIVKRLDTEDRQKPEFKLVDKDKNLHVITDDTDKIPSVWYLWLAVPFFLIGGLIGGISLYQGLGSALELLL